MTDTETTAKVIEFTSPDSATTLYACSTCSLVIPTNSREMAERCCTCAACGAPTVKRATLCPSCSIEQASKRREVEREKLLALPVVEDDGGPVFVHDLDRFFADSDQAADALFDDDMDVADAVVQPCNVVKVGTPDLVEHVEESWSENFEDGYEDGLSKETKAVLTAAYDYVSARAPEAWEMRRRERIVLPERPCKPASAALA